MKKILVFEVNWLGDILFSSPVFKTIKDNLENIFLGCIVPPRGEELLKYNPYIDEIITFDERTSHRSLQSKIQFIKLLKSKNYEEVYLLHRSFTRAFLCWRAGIKKRVGYSTLKRKLILTHPIIPSKDILHKQDYYLYLLEQSGFVVKERVSRIYISDKERTFAQSLLEEYGLDVRKEREHFIAINPGGNWLPKRWPFFGELFNLIHERLPAKIFITGAAQDAEFIESIYKDVFIEYRKKTINLCGRTGLLELAAIFERMDCVVSSDTGPLHIAASIGAKTVGIYGPTHPDITGPRTDSLSRVIFKNVNCNIPCYFEICLKDRMCLTSIKPEEVFENVKGILEQ